MNTEHVDRRQISVEVAFTPCAGSRRRPVVHVVIDVLRATTAIVRMLDAGAASIILAQDDEVAASARRLAPDALLCSELVDGSITPGADFSPSLARLPGDALRGRQVVLRSTNGTVAATEAFKRSGVVLVGSLVNASAVSRAALAAAALLDMPVRLVCSGRESGSTACLDDTYCAGALIEKALALSEGAGLALHLRDSAQVALGVQRGYADAQAALWASESAAVLRGIGAAEDISLAAAIDTSAMVPALVEGIGSGTTRVISLSDVAQLERREAA